MDAVATEANVDEGETTAYQAFPDGDRANALDVCADPGVIAGPTGFETEFLFQIDQALAQGVLHQTGNVVDLQTLHDLRAMGLDSLAGDLEGIGNFLG